MRVLVVKDDWICQIAASMVEFGWTNPILIDENAGILAGHGRLIAARELGLAEVPVIRFRELAVRHITTWTGVELGGGPAPPTPENVAAVMELYPVGERFFQEFTLRQVLLNAAKNGSGPSAAGISSPAEGPTTAGPAKTKGSPAPEARPELTDGSAPAASTP